MQPIKKVELHCHLIGLIGPDLLRQLPTADRLSIDPDELAAIYPVKGTHGFKQWLEITKPFQSASFVAFLPMLKAHMDNLIQQGVVYTELMISPMMFSQGLDNMIREFEEFRSQVIQFERGRIQVEFLLVIPRTLPEDKLQKDVDRFIELAKLGYIQGVALVGLENGTSISPMFPYFSQLKDVGIGIEIHAGEHDGPESVKEALRYGLADRIGHGIRAFEEDNLVNLLVDQQVHLEFCISSNLSTGSVADLSQHPISKARDWGMNFSINTDDPGIFDTSMNKEYKLVENQFGFDHADFEQVYRQSLGARFCKELRHLGS